MALPLPAVPYNLVFLHGRPGDRGRNFTVVLLAEGFTAAEIGAAGKAASVAAASFERTAERIKDFLLAQTPFSRLKDRILVARVDSVSTVSAAAAAAAGQFRPLQAPPAAYLASVPFEAVWDLTTPRLLVLRSPQLVDAVINQHSSLQGARAKIVVVNTADYGGSGGNIACISCHPACPETAVHEMGHSAFHLADEYEHGCTASRVVFNAAATTLVWPNVSASFEAEKLPWADMLTPGGPPLPSTAHVPGTSCPPSHTIKNEVADGDIGAFEGGFEFACGVFRPTQKCRMRDKGVPFCPVCDRAISLELIRAIRAAAPATTVQVGVWTHAADLDGTMGPSFAGSDFVVFYNSVSAQIDLRHVADLATGSPQATAALAQTSIEPGWVTMLPIPDAGSRFILFTEPLSGRRAIYEVHPDRIGGTVPVFEKRFDSGPDFGTLYSHVVASRLGGAAHVLSYSRFTGEVRLERLDQAAGVLLVPVAETRTGSAAPWQSAWTGVSAVEDGGVPLVVSVNATLGVAQVSQLNAPPQVIPPGTPMQVLTDLWRSPPGFMPGVRTHLSAVVPRGRAAVFSYSALDGHGYVHGIRPVGKALEFNELFMLGLGGLSLLDTGAPALGSFDVVSAGAPLRSFLWLYNASVQRMRMVQLK